MCDKKLNNGCQEVKVILPLFSCFILMWSTVPKEQKLIAIEEILDIITKDSDIPNDLIDRFYNAIKLKENVENSSGFSFLSQIDGHGIIKETSIA